MLLLPLLSTGQIIDMDHHVWVIIIVIAYNLYMLEVSLWHFPMARSVFGLKLCILVKGTVLRVGTQIIEFTRGRGRLWPIAFLLYLRDSPPTCQYFQDPILASN